MCNFLYLTTYKVYIYICYLLLLVYDLTLTCTLIFFEKKLFDLFFIFFFYNSIFESGRIHNSSTTPVIGDDDPTTS